MSAGREQLQELSEQLQEIEGQIEQLQGTVEEIQGRQSAADEAMEALDTLESGSTVQVPLGGGAYVRATIEDIDEVIVDIGGDYAAELDRGRATETLENKQDRLGERIDEVTGRIAELESQSEELEQQAQQVQQQALQQQMQGMQEPDE